MNEEAIFSAAVAKPDPQERAAYLEQACDGDAELRAHVEALLEAHENPDSFFSQPLQDGEQTVGLPSPTVEQAGQMIGRYKLRERLGEGGFGVVWAAEQVDPVRRKVALKIIKPGMDTEAVVARFEAERQALALMDHPNIAHVLDGGATDAGRPYFVMELIRGVSITDYCDRNKLTVAERLALFVEVCRAVQHAHQKGIIHRDIKPSNVLITLHDGKPVPKIIDFGIAKALNQQLTDKTIYTRVHQAIGTLAYMSPEQAELSGLDVDTRADVYGLGVLLYELLTGTTPFDKHRLEEAAFHEACRIIREEDPPKASTRISGLGETATAISSHRHTDPARLRQLVHGDLDWILMKSLDKDRTRRYQSANDFSADVERYVNDKPVEARPPSTWYRFQKYSRRHRSFVVGAAVIVIMLILGLAGISSAYVVEVRAAARERALAEELQVALADAQVANEQAQARLTELREALLERGFLLAFTGDLEGVKQVIESGKLAGLGEEWYLTLEGAAHLFRADVKKAMELLERAAKEEDNVSAVALLATAYMQSLEYSKYERLYPKLQKLQPRTAYKDYDEFLLAYARGDRSFAEAVDCMQSVLRRRPAWILLKALESDNRLGAAQQTGDSRQLETAIQIAESLHAVYPDNQFVNRCRLATLMTALEFSRHHELDSMLELKAKAFEAAESVVDYNLADRLRPHFFDIVGETEKAHVAWIKAAKSGSPLIVLDAVGFLYRNGCDTDAWTVVSTCQEDTPEIQIARAYMLVDSPQQREQALRLAVSAVEACPTWWMRQMASKVFLLLGDAEGAREHCLSWVQSDTVSDYSCPWIWLDQQSVRYLAHDIDPDEYEQSDTTRWGDFYRHYTLGCEEIGKGNWKEARAHLQICDERGSFISPEASWAKVFLKRLEEDSEWPRGHELRLETQ